MRRKLRAFWNVYIEGWYWCWGEYGGSDWSCYGIGWLTVIRNRRNGKIALAANNEWLHWKVGEV